MTYTISTTVEGKFDEVVELTIDELKKEGFGVICDIDVKSTLKEKLGEEFIKYRILGACNPKLAHNGLEEELELGVLLPCNIIIYERQDGEIVVSAVDPEKLVGITGNKDLDNISKQTKKSFKKIIQKL